MAVINFEIFKVIGTLSEDKDGWKKQLTCTSWGKYNPKFDLRAWDSEYTSMKKRDYSFLRRIDCIARSF